MGGTNDDRNRDTPVSNCERAADVDRGSRRGRSRTRQGSYRRERRYSRDKQVSPNHNKRDKSRATRENRPSRSRSRHDSYRRSRRRSQTKTNRTSRSYSRRRSGVRSRSDSRKRNFDLYERLRLLEDEILRERGLKRRRRDEGNPSCEPRGSPPAVAGASQASGVSEFAKSPNRKNIRLESKDFFEEFVKIFKGKDRESFPTLNNVIPEFDPLAKEQTIDMWLSKVEECTEIYSWNDKQTIHYALPKLVGHAKAWYQGLPSIKHTWSEWKLLLKESFPSTENYAELLTEMLNRRSRIGESLELYYFSKINLLNRCKIFGKQAVDCLIFGIEDKGVRLSAQAGKFDRPEDALEFIKSVKNQSSTDFIRDNRDRRFPNSSQTTNYSAQRGGDATKVISKESIVCFNCKESGHPSFRCPKPRIQCSECKLLGHKDKDCPKKNNKTQNTSADKSNAKNVLEV